MKPDTLLAVLIVAVCGFLGGHAGYAYADGTVKPSPQAPSTLEMHAVTSSGSGEVDSSLERIATYNLALAQHGIPASDVEKATVAVYGAIAGLPIGALLALLVYIPVNAVLQHRRRRRYLARASL